MSSEKQQLERAERELAQLRALVRDALRRFSDAGEGESEDWQEGYRQAYALMREALAPEPRPSARQAMIGRTAINVGLEPGGRGTGHLEALWDAAYKEGQRDALTAGPLL